MGNKRKSKLGSAFRTATMAGLLKLSNALESLAYMINPNKDDVRTDLRPIVLDADSGNKLMDEIDAIIRVNEQAQLTPAEEQEVVNIINSAPPAHRYALAVHAYDYSLTGSRLEKEALLLAFESLDDIPPLGRFDEAIFISNSAEETGFQTLTRQALLYALDSVEHIPDDKKDQALNILYRRVPAEDRELRGRVAHMQTKTPSGKQLMASFTENDI